MGGLDKLVERLRQKPPKARFSAIERLLNAYNFYQASSRGSHHVFRHEDGRQVTVCKTGGRMVKTTYIVRVLELLGLEED